MEPDAELVLIVGAARSGTTLLRLILDCHPEIGSPAEAGIPALIDHATKVWWTIEGADVERRTARVADDFATGHGEQGRQAPPLTLLTPHAQSAVRETVVRPMNYYCARGGKRIYCDKSLDSVHYLESVKVLFPSARYLLVFRHAMDTVASGLEACPWGFSGYGYAPFVQRSPDNLVCALVTYWLEHVARALEWEDRHPELCHRVRYEDLVAHAKDTAAAALEFLGVERDLSILEKTFDRGPVMTGPGDHKVTYTAGIHGRSRGRGKRVPVSMIPPPLLDAMNARLEALGYGAVGPAWNSEPAEGAKLEQAGGAWGAALAEAMAEAGTRLSSGDEYEAGSIAIIAQDAESLRWVWEPRAARLYQGDGEVERVVTGAAEDLVMMIRNEVDVGTLLRSGRIRLLSAGEDSPYSDEVRVMTSVLSMFRG